MLAYDNVWNSAYSDKSIISFDFTIHPDWHFRFEDDYARVGRLTATWAWDALEFA